MTMPAITPDMATPDTQGNTHDYVYDYTSWLCPKATPTQLFLAAYAYKRCRRDLGALLIH